MLIYTHRLKNHINKNLLPILLMSTDKYLFKGNFKEKNPYVTNIIVENYVCPEINKSNIYDNLIQLINRIDNKKNIILAKIICGIDNRFYPRLGTSEELEKIKKLLDDKEREYFNVFLNKYNNDNEKKKFHINKLLKKHYEILWTKNEIINNKKNFIDILTNNSIIILQYYVKIESYFVNISVIVEYDISKNNKSTYQIQKSPNDVIKDSSQYYQMLHSLAISNKIKNIIEKKFGLYKQINARIESYCVLYDTNNLDIGMATEIIISIIKDLQHMPEFKSSTIKQIKKIYIDNSPDVKMSSCNIILNVLYDEINAYLDVVSKKYYEKYSKKMIK